MISIENLTKFIDLSQLTPDFDGTLHYDHKEWMELRVVSFFLFWRSLHRNLITQIWACLSPCAFELGKKGWDVLLASKLLALVGVLAYIWQHF